MVKHGTLLQTCSRLFPIVRRIWISLESLEGVLDPSLSSLADSASAEVFFLASCVRTPERFENLCSSKGLSSLIVQRIMYPFVHDLMYWISTPSEQVPSQSVMD